MTREEAKKYLSSKLPVLSAEMREAIKVLEQEPVLDKVREEIEQKLGIHGTISLYNKAINDVLEIIDKHKAESEETNI